MNLRRAAAIIGKLVLVIGLSMMFVGPAVADSYNIVADITADNHYGLFFGNAAGTNLTLVGRNEPDDNGTGPNGGCGWTDPERWTFNVPSGSYLYVLAWNVDGPQMWIGQVKKADGSYLYSNTADWVYTVGSGSNPSYSPTSEYPDGVVPSLTTVKADIANANAKGWGTPLASAPNDGNQIWSSDPDNNIGIPGISPNANFIWHDTFSLDGDLSSSQDNYAIFRTADPVATPVPASVLLTGSGLLGLGLLRWRKKAAMAKPRALK